VLNLRARAAAVKPVRLRQRYDEERSTEGEPAPDRG
jgi:hypothetical protein